MGNVQFWDHHVTANPKVCNNHVITLLLLLTKEQAGSIIWDYLTAVMVISVKELACSRACPETTAHLKSVM